MSTAARLGAFAAGLVVLFGGSWAAGAVLVPDSAAEGTADHADHGDTAHADRADHEGHADHAGTGAAGLASAQDGYRLVDVAAPTAVGQPGTLSFRLLDADGAPVTTYDEVHDEELHLVVVRTDGADFRHVHPTRADDGTWSVPWTWSQAGAYRLYADTSPTDGPALVLGAVLEVAGDLAPVTPEPTRDAVVDGYEVYLGGNLLAGGTSELTAEVRRGGEPVTTLEPYLGAFGHLVALRADDLAYLHVHPTAEDPGPEDRSGPDIAFEAHVDTPGRYLLYLDFQVDGQVRTATFVVDAVPVSGGGHDHGGHDHGSHDHGDGGSAEEDGHDHDH